MEGAKPIDSSYSGVSVGIWLVKTTLSFFSFKSACLNGLAMRFSFAVLAITVKTSLVIIPCGTLKPRELANNSCLGLSSAKAMLVGELNHFLSSR
ncbi:hypothetical protein [Vibrio gallaecicus]|uniref:hypothetical protein n=1 Tax=Vibrio gallaecicus TaxID=552386 RepID=UPI0025B513D3|nr:hypothetical protein [Vibrio gallaecicus]MDN3617039.1 hypothetical protein [Vibrio gallaecicus]